MRFNALQMPDVKKNVLIPASAASYFDEITSRMLNNKGHGLMFTACLLAFAALDDDEQKRILGEAMHFKGDLLTLPQAIDHSIGAKGHLMARKPIKQRSTK